MTSLLKNFAIGSLVSISAICNAASSDTNQSYSTELLETGRTRFAANCGFCHGRDAAGGAQGLDLIRSELVAEDNNGNLINEVVRNGRIDTEMPAFNAISDSDLSAIVAYIHNQKILSELANGGRRSVEPADLATGNAVLGRQYFETACSSCHSASSDLSDIAARFEGLALLRRMLYPDDGAQGQVTVTTAEGESITGTQAYRDEFTIAIRDEAGNYRSWSTRNVTYTVDNPLAAHVEQLARYTDDDMHNVLAYLQTLR